MVRRWFRGRTLVLLSLLVANGLSAATIDVEKAGRLMAAYMWHIAGFTTWPAEKVGNKKRPIAICVLGADPKGVGPTIVARIESPKGLQAKGRPLQVLNLRLFMDQSQPDTILAELQRCDLLFMSEGSDVGWSQIKSIVGPLPIVTVSDMAGFAEQGGMIEYFIDDKGHVRMIVNIAARKRAGVVLSAKLLALKSVRVLGEEEDA